MKREDMGAQSDGLVSAIEAAGDAPCDKYACEKRQLCAGEELACTAFRWFVHSGKSVSPHVYVPIRLSKFNPTEWRDEIEPTREIYNSIADL